MVRRALVAGAAALPVTGLVGYMAGGTDAAWSAAIGIAVVTLNFAAHGLSLAWAAGVSITAVQVTALGGLVVRMGIIAAALLGLNRTEFFSPIAFAAAAVAGTVALLIYEARLVMTGVGRDLDIPPDQAAVAAAEQLRLREGRR